MSLNENTTGLEDILARVGELPEAASKPYVHQLVKTAAPRNLLDNSDFRNPVNQIGKTVYSEKGYTIDRWTMPFSSEVATVTITDDGLNLDMSESAITFAQKVEDSLWKRMIASGKKYTVVLNYTVHAVGSGYGFIQQGKKTGGVGGSYLILNKSTGTHTTIGFLSPLTDEGTSFYSPVWLCLSQGWNVTLHCIALYEGEYTLDTLPEYKPKGYGAELAECMRYYQSYGAGLVLYYSGTNFTLTFPYKTEMRITPPTVTLTTNNILIYGLGGATAADITVSNFTKLVHSVSPDGAAVIVLSGTPNTTITPGAYRANQLTDYITFSADL